MFDFSQFNIAGFTKAIENHVVEVTESLATKVYNHIILNDYPYWSGSYISSWNINIGSIDPSYNEPPSWGSSEEKVSYSVPEIVNKLHGLKPYQAVYVSNATPHAEKIEDSGTKTSEYTPWKIAYHAFNNVSKSFVYA